MIRRGDVYWADFGPIVDSRPAKRRPAVVVSHNQFNSSRIQTVLLAAITSNTAVAAHPGNVFLPAAESGLPKDSAVNLSQLSTVDKRRLLGKAGSLPDYLLDEVDTGLRLVLGL